MKKHIGYYVSFFLILTSGIYVVLQTQGDKAQVMEFVGILAVSYVIWGILHHLVHHSVTMRIVLEYVIIASLGVAVIFFILNGGL